MGRSVIVGALEIGTAKVVAIIGEIVNGQSLDVIGVGEVVSKGIKKGEVYDFKAASTSTHAAVLAAEKVANVQLETLFLAQTGRHLEGNFSQASVNVSASDSRVSQSDIARVTQEAKAKELPKNRVYLNHVQNPFRLDEHPVLNPLGMEGEKLSVDYWSIHADMNKVKNNIHIVNGFGLKVEDMIISSVASGSIIASDIEKKNGVLVLDIGCGTTDYAIYKEGFIVRTGVVPVGGDHLTNDISLGLRVGTYQAEQLKLECAKAKVDAYSESEIELERDSTVLSKRSVQKKAIGQIVQARLEELFGLIRKELDIASLAAGCLLTGGTSRLIGIESLATEVLGLPTRLGDNPEWASNNLKDPEYSTVLGLLYCALKSQGAKEKASGKRGKILSTVSKIFSFS